MSCRHGLRPRAVLLVSEVLDDAQIRDFAYQCLAGLDQFKMTDDRNGVATKGLLYLERLATEVLRDGSVEWHGLEGNRIFQRSQP